MGSIPCLRPEFTTLLAARLLDGESLNLISPHGQGRRRTLDDLHNILPTKSLIIQMNMRTYRSDYKGFIETFMDSFDCRDHHIKCLSEFLELLSKEKQKVIIILHNFDEIRNSKASEHGFSNIFFSDLNTIRNQPNIALLCVCEQRFEHYLVRADGSPLPDSSLNAQAVELPALRSDQLLAELEQRDLPLADNELPALSEWLIKQPAPYSILDQLIPDWFRNRIWQQK